MNAFFLATGSYITPFDTKAIPRKIKERIEFLLGFARLSIEMLWCWLVFLKSEMLNQNTLALIL